MQNIPGRLRMWLPVQGSDGGGSGDWGVRRPLCPHWHLVGRGRREQEPQAVAVAQDRAMASGHGVTRPFWHTARVLTPQGHRSSRPEGPGRGLALQGCGAATSGWRSRRAINGFCEYPC